MCDYINMKTYKFRAWDKINKKWLENINPQGNKLNKYFIDFDGFLWERNKINDESFAKHEIALMQWTGLVDKNGKEIFEFMELNNKWEVDWLSGKYILRDISNGDIIDLDYENKYEITREYTKV